MEKIPRKKSIRQKVILEATYDFYGKGGISKYKLSANKIALWLMGRKSKLEKLNDEEREVLWYIKKNLKDKTYRNEILKDLMGKSSCLVS